MASRSKKHELSRDAVETMRRLEGIVASAMDGIITINDVQRVILFNPAAERMFGLSAKRRSAYRSPVSCPNVIRPRMPTTSPVSRRPA